MEDEYKSKSQKKREMTELQDLGERLAAMPLEKIRALDIPEPIREAALFAHSLTKHEARRRHMQYLGKLMRAESENIDALREAMDRVDQARRAADDIFHQLEEWRDRLVAGDDDLVEEIVTAHPAADRQRLRTLARNAASEAKADKPPKAARTLFKYLREVAAS
ncbi:ribosome biogenesis factor YjgA [Desulfocurvus sp. DL9XJH121]